MAHEVVKRVGERAYRYRVESYRDPATGKVRGRWTYLGKAERSKPPVRRNPAHTRERLLAALSRLLEQADFSDITAGRIAQEAGLAHGTFYRHFTDKRAALRAALDQLRASLERERPPSFEGSLGSLDEERRRVRAWLSALFRVTVDQPGLLRAAYSISASDPVFRGEMSERRRARNDGWERYIGRLSEQALIAPVEPRGSANALGAIFDGLFRLSALDGTVIDEATVAGVVTVFDRALFQAQR